MADRELSIADKFAQANTPASASISSDLVADAQSLRYANKGELSTPSLTVVNANGGLDRSSLPNLKALPSGNLVGRCEQFDASSQALRTEITALRGAISQDDPSAARRTSLLAEADALSATATTIYYGGNLQDGERALRMAHALVDVASRFIPGVSWGRDVYEAVTGNDMLSGQPLDATARTIAILGAVTAGVGDDAVGGLRVIDEIIEAGESERGATEIIEAAKTLKSGGLEMTTHATQEMHDPLGYIDQSEINDAIDRGSRWWNTQEKTIVAIERDPAPGEVRVAAGVDTTNGKITTVYREVKTDAELRSDVTDAGMRRYIEISK